MEYKALCEIATVTSSKRIFAEQYVSEGVPFYRQKEIIEKHDKKQLSDPLYISEEVYENIKSKFGIPKEGDLLLSAVGVTLGIPYIVQNEKFYFKDGNLIWLKDFKKDINSKYIYYWIDSKFGLESIFIRAIGSAQPALTIDLVKKYKMFFPEKSKQDKIVNILSRYDEAIENNNKRIKLLEQMAQNLYKEWFVRFRFPGWENCEFENGIPKGWHQGKFSELFEFKRGKNITADEMIEGQVPVISAGISPSGYHIEANVKGTSLTISSSGANAGYLSIHYEDIWAADCMFITEENTKNIYYLYELLNNIRPVILNQQRGAAQPHVYSKDINNLRLWIPNEELIENANKLFESFHKEIYQLQRANKILAKQRDLLLPRLMSGKLEVR